MQIEMMRLQARAFLSRFIKNEAGITAIEYAVLAAGVAALVTAIAANNDSGLINGALKAAFTKVKTTIGT